MINGTAVSCLANQAGKGCSLFNQRIIIFNNNALKRLPETRLSLRGERKVTFQNYLPSITSAQLKCSFSSFLSCVPGVVTSLGGHQGPSSSQCLWWRGWGLNHQQEGKGNHLCTVPAAEEQLPGSVSSFPLFSLLRIFPFLKH